VPTLDRARDLRAGIDDHHNRRRFFERDPGLTKNLRRNEIFIFGNDAARIHNSKCMSKPFHLAIEAIPRNAGFVSDNSAPRPSQMVEERRFADVRASDNGDKWKDFVFLAQRISHKSLH
jgi:hypothetical protein